jgi:RNA polymerase sigma-70 factor, ECF subfamily
MAPGDVNAPDRTIAELLRALEQGDAAAPGALFAALYRELHDRAANLMRKQPKQLTLQATALINEVYLRLVGAKKDAIHDRDHFLAYAAKAMRHVLVDHARRRKAKLGEEVPLDSIAAAFEQNSYDLERLQQAQAELEIFDPLMAKAVDLRFFAGLAEAEVAQHLEMPLRTFQRRWQATRGWLRTKCHDT